MTTPAFAVNWWQVGWIVANNVIDRVVNLDGQSSNDQYSTYMVSPSIVFNNGTNGGEFYMRPRKFALPQAGTGGYGIRPYVFCRGGEDARSSLLRV